MAKRAYGSGSKREVRPGVWQLRVGGRSSTFRGTGKEAERELARLVAVNDGPSRTRSTPTLTELIAQWRTVARHERSTSQTVDYALAHLPAKLGATRIDRLTLRDFDKLYAGLERDGVGAPMIRKLHAALSAALTQAVRWQMVAVHPARGAQLPAAPVKPRKVLNAADLAAVLEVAQRSLDNEVFFRLAIATGGRRGELVALRWSDIDLNAATVTIGRALRADRSSKGTKTMTTRVLPLDPGTVAVLRRWKAGQAERALHVGSGIVADPFVLTNAVDCSQPWRPEAASQRWERLAERAGVTDVNLHALRHTHVSMLIRAGVDVTMVAKRVGHSRPTTTLDQYAHLVDDGRHAADVIGAILEDAQRHAR